LKTQQAFATGSFVFNIRRNIMAKCPHCGKELEFTVIPRKPRAVKASAKTGTTKTAGTKTKSTTKPVSKKIAEPKPVPKRPLLKNPDFLNPGSIS
jgi:hypothetical protein